MKLTTILLGLLKYAMLLAIVGYLGFALAKMVRPAKELVCTGVVVELQADSTTCLVDSDNVLALLARNKISPKGKSFSQIDMSQISRLLTESPQLDTAWCYRNSAAQLVIRAQAPTPVLHALPDGEREFYLTQSGKAVPPTDNIRNLVVASGNFNAKWATKNLTQLATLLAHDPYWRLQAQQIYVDDKHRIWLSTRIQDHEILLGDTTMMADKLERIRLFYQHGLPQAGWNMYQTIDASFKGQLVCTKSKKRK